MPCAVLSRCLDVRRPTIPIPRANEDALRHDGKWFHDLESPRFVNDQGTPIEQTSRIEADAPKYSHSTCKHSHIQEAVCRARKQATLPRGIFERGQGAPQQLWLHRGAALSWTPALPLRPASFSSPLWRYSPPRMAPESPRLLATSSTKQNSSGGVSARSFSPACLEVPSPSVQLGKVVEVMMEKAAGAPELATP